MSQPNEATVEDTESNVVQLKKTNFSVLPGGKTPDSTYWLRDLPEMYVFITRRKPQGIEYGAIMLQVMKHTENCTALFDVSSNNRFWVHTNDFSRAHQCLEVFPVEVPKEEEVKVENADGPSDRTN